MSDINIGALSEAINDKMDRDLNNRSDDSGLRKLVESYVNGTDWYKIFDEIQSDGTVKQWCEQGGRVSAQSSWKTVSLLKPYKDTNYQVMATANGNVNGTSTWTTVVDSQVYTNDSIQIKGTNASSEWLISWKAEGYIS